MLFGLVEGSSNSLLPLRLRKKMVLETHFQGFVMFLCLYSSTVYFGMLSDDLKRHLFALSLHLLRHHSFEIAGICFHPEMSFLFYWFSTYMTLSCQ
jgi:hypothetical protein